MTFVMTFTAPFYVPPIWYQNKLPIKPGPTSCRCYIADFPSLLLTMHTVFIILVFYWSFNLFQLLTQIFFILLNDILRNDVGIAAFRLRDGPIAAVFCVEWPPGAER